MPLKDALTWLREVGPHTGPPIVNQVVPYPTSYLRWGMNATYIVDAIEVC